MRCYNLLVRPKGDAMAHDFIPPLDGDFDEWAENFDTWLQEYGGEVGVSEEQLARSAELFAAWRAHYRALLPALTAYQGVVTAKTEAGKSYIALARGLVGMIQSNPDTDDEQRRALKIPVHKTTRTAPRVPASVPVCQITPSRLRHSLDFRDEHHMTRRAKPEGVRGCQIWIFIDAARALAATEAGDFRYLAEATKTPFHHDFRGEEVGQTAHYQLRWINSRGETGPWSAVVSATIGA